MRLRISETLLRRNLELIETSECSETMSWMNVFSLITRDTNEKIKLLNVELTVSSRDKKLRKIFDCLNCSISTRNWLIAFCNETMSFAHCDEYESLLTFVLKSRKLLTIKTWIVRRFSLLNKEIESWSIWQNSWSDHASWVISLETEVRMSTRRCLKLLF